MKRSTRTALALAALSVGFFLVACGKAVMSVDPSPTPPAEGGISPVSWSNGRTREPQTARARLRFVAPLVLFNAAGETRFERNAEFLVDADDLAPSQFVGRDTVPAHAVLKQVRWRVVTDTSVTFVVDEAPDFRDTNPFPPADGHFAPGGAILQLNAPARAGGGRIVVSFHMNYPPDVWWAGPDPTRFPQASDGDGRAVDVLDWRDFRTTPAWPPDGRPFFGPESLATLPHQRTPLDRLHDRRTFYEIWGDRIYAREEGGSVHEGATLVFMLGGRDADSPYGPPLDASAPTLPPGWDGDPGRYPVLSAHGLVGSPNGFRFEMPVQTSVGITQPSECTTFPNFRIADVAYFPAIAGYIGAYAAGKAYVIPYPVDGSGTVGRGGLVDWISLTDRVDAGGGTPEERELRKRVLTFMIRPAAGAGARIAQNTSSSK